MTWAPFVLATFLALVTAAATPTILRRLPEPAHAEGKPRYSSLAEWRSVLGVLAASLFAGLVAAWRGDVVLFLPVTTACALAIVIDARTTWLPLPLAHAAWGLTGLTVGWHAVISGPAVVPRAVVGALVAGAVLWLCWRFAGFGFGDVRLATVLGACAGAHAWTLLYPTLLLGTLVGALWGLASRLRGRRGAFPYGPGLWLGAVLALLLTGPVRP